MQKSFTGERLTQLRQFERMQRQAATQLESWLQRLEILNPAVPRRRTRSPGPAVQPPSRPLPGKWESHRLSLMPMSAGELVPHVAYHLYVPSGARGRPLPLVLMLHGCRQTPEDLAEGTRMNALAEREGFIVAYPQQPLRRQLQRCWQWFDLAATEGGREAQALAALIDELGARPDVSASEIYLAGLSAGAAMAAVVALRYPEKVAAVGLHSGVVIGAADSPRSGLKVMQRGSGADPAWLLDAAGIVPGGPEMPAIVVHGLADDAVHPVNARLLARQFLTYNRLDDRIAMRPVTGDAPSVQPLRLPPGHYIEERFGRWNRDLVTLVEVEGLDHAWSGGDERYRYHSAMGPDASELMWSFFRRYRR